MAGSRLPKVRKAHAAVALGIAATATLVLVGPGSTAAMAGRMIGSAAIINNSIQSGDIRNDTIQSGDVRNSSIQGADVRNGSLDGRRLRRRHARSHLAQPALPSSRHLWRGQQWTGSTSTWNIHNASPTGPYEGFQLISATNVPAGTQVEAVKLTLPDDVPGCPSAYMQVRANGSSASVAASTWRNGAWGTVSLQGGGVITTQSTPLTFTLYCQGDTEENPVPPFDASVTLAFTDRSAPATSSFN